MDARQDNFLGSFPGLQTSFGGHTNRFSLVWTVNDAGSPGNEANNFPPTHKSLTN